MLPLHSAWSWPPVSARITDPALPSAFKHTNFTPSSTFTKATLSTMRVSASRSTLSLDWSFSPRADRKWSISSICWTLPPLSIRNSCTARSVHGDAIIIPNTTARTRARRGLKFCRTKTFQNYSMSVLMSFTEVGDNGWQHLLSQVPPLLHGECRAPADRGRT